MKSFLLLFSIIKKASIALQQQAVYSLLALIRQCLDPFKLSKILQDSPSHRIFRHMYGALNVGKKITNCTVCL
jgi:hypothetical protein